MSSELGFINGLWALCQEAIHGIDDLRAAAGL